MKASIRRYIIIMCGMIPPAWSCAQALHSSVDPKHVVNWETIGLHSSLNPTLWMTGERTSMKVAYEKKDSVPLKEPIITPYRSEEAMKEAQQQQERDAMEAAPYQTGKATYYSARMHGRKMSDGTRYDRNAFTCAHRTLPFGTMVKVVNKKNGRETIVRVADRGPFGKGLVIDLSNSAAAALGMISDGVVPVELYVIK